MKICTVLLFLAVAQSAPINFDQAISIAAQRYEKFFNETEIGKFPEKTDASGHWTIVDSHDWVSGFYPGCLWYLYELTGDQQWKDRAIQAQVPLVKEAYSSDDHDIGFRIMSSYGNGLRLTGDSKFQKLIDIASSSLVKRFNPKVGVIKSWNWPTFPVIIDNMMNLHLLFASSENDPHHDYYLQVAETHASTTLREHFRYPEMSTYHVVDYNVNTGIPNTKGTAQGYSFNSTWARGQAWAVYGFVEVYSYTKDERFLKASTEAAEFYLANGLPEDHVPFWDFYDPRIPNIWRDTSAATPLACGLLKLSQLEQEPLQSKWFTTAEKILSSLITPQYLNVDNDVASVLSHATQNAPGGSFDTGIIFGDYYLLEAITLYKNMTSA